jgi:probable HAF family extracellular repeat protein
VSCVRASSCSFCVSVLFAARAAIAVTTVELGDLGGGFSQAVAVNASSQVVGLSDTAGGATHAFSWTQAGGMTHALSVQQSPEIPSAYPLLAMMLNAVPSQLLRVAAQLGIAALVHDGPKIVQQPSPQRPGKSAMRPTTPLLAFMFLLLSSTPAAHADFIFNNGTTNTVASPINDRVQI